MKRQHLTEEQAKNYIETGNIFGEKKCSAAEREKAHIDRLYNAIIRCINDGTAKKHKENVLYTLQNYIKNHPQSEKLKSLLVLVKNA